MEAVAYSTFRKNLKSYMHQVNDDAEELLVTNADPADNVIVMSVRDYDALMETLRIYANPALRDKIVRGLEQVRAGDVSEHALVDPEDPA